MQHACDQRCIPTVTFSRTLRRLGYRKLQKSTHISMTSRGVLRIRLRHQRTSPFYGGADLGSLFLSSPFVNSGSTRSYYIFLLSYLSVSLSLSHSAPSSRASLPLFLFVSLRYQLLSGASDLPCLPLLCLAGSATLLLSFLIYFRAHSPSPLFFISFIELATTI